MYDLSGKKKSVQVPVPCLCSTGKVSGVNSSLFIFHLLDLDLFESTVAPSCKSELLTASMLISRTETKRKQFCFIFLDQVQE